MRARQWNPFQELAEFERTVDRMMGRRIQRRSYGYPPIDLIDTGDAFLLFAFLPGIDPDQISLSVFEKTVTLSGNRRPAVIEGAKPIYRERLYGRFHKRIDLPDPVQEEEIDANYTNGVLQMTLPKRPLRGPRRISVKWNP